jgi:hypothetical protein
VTLQAADLAPARFVDVVRGTRWPENTRVMALAAAQAWFAYLHEVPEEALTAEQGRIFHQGGELRWRVVDDQVRAVYLGADALDGLTDASEMLEGLARRERILLLWGERTDLEPEWRERQVPHVFRYPFHGGALSRGRLGVVIEEWVDSAGLVRFARYVDVRELEG